TVPGGGTTVTGTSMS
nr:immunoglobulin heavy chain junction region [Mus musculus]